jgi:asparagine synthase (glutamine-hydrolysing)
MCGILGFFGGRAELLEPANELQRHRGPDDSGVFFDADAGVGLAHRRLSILDLSQAGHQPMLALNGRVALVFNGEIYNFSELRKDLEAGGVRFSGHSDTEVLLQLYLRDGEDLLPRLSGIFAFAIWDSWAGTLFAARDAMGVKPLYYSECGGRFSFASELKALMCLVPECRELDRAALYRYLTFLWCPGEGTPLRGVRKMGPGEALRVRAGKIEKRWTWYRLPIARGVGAALAESESIAGIREHLRQAVRRQMVADVPVGAFLSGGLDSSAVVALAREENPDIRCFTIDVAGGEPEGMVNDLPYARAAARHLGVSLETVTVDSSLMAGDLVQMVEQLDEPLADPAPLNALYISQLARRQGVKVLLSGAGGDDIFSGYRRHFALHFENYWRWMPVSVQQTIGSIAGGIGCNYTHMRRLAKLMDGVALKDDHRLVNFFRWGKSSDLAALCTSNFLGEVAGVEMEAPMLEFLANIPQETSPLRKMLALEQRFFLADHNLIYTDKMSMAAGVEVRVPFLDPDLVEFAGRIPDRFLQRGREGKWALKKAMEPYLPSEIIYRPKTGFGVPLRGWMGRELRALIQEFLSPESLGRRGLFESDRVQQLIARSAAGKVDGAYTILSLLCIEIWCRKFLDTKENHL